VADVSRHFDSQLLSGRHAVRVGSGCAVTAVILLCLGASFYASSKMSQRLQHLRQEQNELGYQHTLVSRVMFYLLMSARRITCDIYVHKISLPRWMLFVQTRV
jgi:hypothetical protein